MAPGAEDARQQFEFASAEFQQALFDEVLHERDVVYSDEPNCLQPHEGRAVIKVYC